MSDLVRKIAGTADDFEWYPTTQEIIDAVTSSVQDDIENLLLDDSPSILDCGAGDGRVLNAFKQSKKYAIEKSRPLLDALARNIFVVGTEFQEQTLIDKKVDIIFSNPPYSEFVAWSKKIISEANAGFIYLVIPKRWVNNQEISDALALREAEASVIGSFDFENADRQARAKVDIVKISLGYYSRHRRNQCKTDPFTIWFNQHFSISADKDDLSDYRSSGAKRESLKASLNQLVSGDDLIRCLVKLYQKELAELINTYKKLESIDADLLDEMDVNLKAVCEALKLKITSLKDRYWKELFENLSQVTSKLTHKSRKALMDKLTEHTHIDFTASNAYALIIWVLKNANHYFDDQLIETVWRMTEAANIKLYKSNQRTYGVDDWRYSRKPEGLDRYALEYRIVLHRIGGLCTSTWGYEKRRWGGLSECAFKFLGDLRTIASNLGYSTDGFGDIGSYDWPDGKQTIECTNLRTMTREVLFTAKAFKNGNLHLKLNQSFILRLNVVFGELNGWIKSPQEAADEMCIDDNLFEVAECFGSNLQLGQGDILMLESSKASIAA